MSLYTKSAVGYTIFASDSVSLIIFDAAWTNDLRDIRRPTWPSKISFADIGVGFYSSSAPRCLRHLANLTNLELHNELPGPVAIVEDDVAGFLDLMVDVIQVFGPDASRRRRLRSKKFVPTSLKVCF